MTDLWERDEKTRFIWTVEHIFPQGESIPDCWVNMIADGDRDLAEEHRKARSQAGESDAHRLQ
jgi:hypothetical protein